MPSSQIRSFDCRQTSHVTSPGTALCVVTTDDGPYLQWQVLADDDRQKVLKIKGVPESNLIDLGSERLNHMDCSKQKWTYAGSTSKTAGIQHWFWHMD